MSAADHGSASTYTNHKCRCEPCRAAWATSVREVKARRTANGLAPQSSRHGTENGYGNYGCRCEPCTAAWSKAALERLHRRQGRVNA